MELLSKERLLQTSSVDHADWNYDPRLAYVMRRRFALAERLLPGTHVHRLLEIGFGSGIFMPELASRCDELYGIDVHSHVAEVEEQLGSAGVRASLSCQDAAALAFPDAFFDVIVSVSAMEFVQDIAGAAAQAARALRRGGRLIVVMPVKSQVLDAILHVLTGADALRDYGDRRERVLPALLQHFRVVKKTGFVPAYRAYALEPR